LFHFNRTTSWILKRIKKNIFILLLKRTVYNEWVRGVCVPGPLPPELSRMFPTPPSTENPFSEQSPMQGSEFTDTMIDAIHHHHHHLHHHVGGGVGGVGGVVKEELVVHSTIMAHTVRKVSKFKIYFVLIGRANDISGEWEGLRGIPVYFGFSS